MKDTFEKLEIPNYKYQIPKHFFFWNLEFEIWCLNVIWDLLYF
jgi:hypothetical protein